VSINGHFQKRGIAGLSPRRDGFVTTPVNVGCVAQSDIGTGFSPSILDLAR